MYHVDHVHSFESNLIFQSALEQEWPPPSHVLHAIFENTILKVLPSTSVQPTSNDDGDFTALKSPDAYEKGIAVGIGTAAAVGTAAGVGATIVQGQLKAPHRSLTLTAEAAVEQRPAAYRFTPRDGQIDVLPEPPEPEDREFAVDTYNELSAKARELLDRLKGSNSAARVCDSMERLLTSLGMNFDDLRPGVLLSRVRSIEADRAAFDTEEGRAELFADALARLEDTLQTARDLMAAFPIVRRIEAERLALDLDRRPDAVPVIEQQTKAISAAAQQSQAVTPGAITALQQNDAAVNAASDPLLRTSLVADNLLVFRNFGWATVASKIASEVGELGSKTWQAVKVGVPEGIGLATRAAPLMLLADWVVGPLAAIAAVVPAFKPLAGKLQTVAKPAPDPIPVHKPKPARRPKAKGGAKKSTERTPGREAEIKRWRAQIAALRRELEQLETGQGWRPTEIRTGADLTAARIEELKKEIAALEAGLAYTEKREQED